ALLGQSPENRAHPRALGELRAKGHGGAYTAAAQTPGQHEPQQPSGPTIREFPQSLFSGFSGGAVLDPNTGEWVSTGYSANGHDPTAGTIDALFESVEWSQADLASAFILADTYAGNGAPGEGAETLDGFFAAAGTGTA